MSSKSFADLGVSKPVVRALAASRHRESVRSPAARHRRRRSHGHDVLVQSPTGSGKTLAFGVPLVDIVEPLTAVARRP